MDTLKRLGLAALVLLATTLATAAPVVTPRLIAEGLTQPLAIVPSNDQSMRLFIVEKVGRIRILQNGVLQPAPFLDITTRVSTSGERGLLGLAFDPDYENTRRFFVYYTRTGDGAIRVSSFTTRVGFPNQADPNSEQCLLVIAHPGADNHNGGQLAFRQGFLYIGTGDGGGGGDPNNNAQSDGSLLGKILRLDVSRAQPTPEVWAKGLRNPWRFSFDRATGDLYIGDVGQDRFEEVDYVPNDGAGGRNFGWRVIEATTCFNPPSGCTLPGSTPPILSYGHQLGQAIIGGYVYRGLKSRDLYGYYVYGDFASNRIWAARRLQAGWVTEQILAPGAGPNGISAFGEDETGELYLASYNDGRIYALDGTATTRDKAGVVSGLWWSGESGWGLQLTQRGDVIFTTIYHYGPDGQPKWYIASNCRQTAQPQYSAIPVVCDGDVYEVQGPRFLGVPFDPSAVRPAAVGSIRIFAFDSEDVDMNLTIGGVTRFVNLSRNIFRDRVTALPTDYSDLYYTPSEPGWGLTISHQGDVLFVAWYVYDDAGNPAWYVASSCNVTGNGCAGTLYKATGPPFAQTFDPSAVVITPVGNLSLAFDNANDATLAYTVNGVSGSKRITRFQF